MAAKACIGLTRRDGVTVHLLLAETRLRVQGEKQTEDVANDAKRRRRERDEDVSQ